jgi:16S rRNA (adenine1518-N6/adenine1519-N6)-dimethyltransferase
MEPRNALPDALSASANQTLSFLQRRFREVGIRPKTQHGQNFLIDLNLLRLLFDSAEVTSDDVVLEVGAGTGALTAMLAERAAAVVSVEIDSEVAALAEENLATLDRVTLLVTDALRNKNHLNPVVMDAVAEKLAAAPGRRLKLVANLPYHVGTPIISNLLVGEPLPHSMTVTIQKEVADRLRAAPGTKDYGATSVWVQSQCAVELVRNLPPSAFWPRPKVTSSIVRIVFQPERRARLGDTAFFHGFVRSMFLHRRKFLRSVMVAAYKQELDKPAVDAILETMGLGPEARAEQLEIEQFVRLAELVRERLGAAG